MHRLRLALRLARRELRGGFAGFRIFFLCLTLGSAAIAGVESLSDAFLTGLQDQGRVLLGGDVSVQLVHRPAGNARRRSRWERQGFLSGQPRPPDLAGQAEQIEERRFVLLHPRRQQCSFPGARRRLEAIQSFEDSPHPLEACDFF